MRPAFHVPWAAALAVAMLAGLAAAADPPPPRALVLEYADPHTKALGAARALASAGFDVAPFPRDRPVRPGEADLVVLGSFTSEHLGFRKLRRTQGDALARFVAAGGVVLHLTQADQTQERVPMLPAGLAAYRSDADFVHLHVIADGHPLLENLPRDGRDPSRLVLPRHLGRPPSWETFVWQKGFRVVAAGKASGQFPVLLEGAHGKGRVVLTSLFLDKLVDEQGREKGDDAVRAVSRTFFANLAAYVRAVRAGEAAPVEPTPSPRAPGEGLVAGDPLAVAWSLETSGIAVYDGYEVVGRGAAEIRKRPRVFTLHGHALRDGGQYRPVDARRADLPALLAFRLPPAEQAQAAPAFELTMRDVASVRVEGRVTSRAAGPGVAFIEATYTFASKGRPKASRYRVRAGEASVRCVFDRAAGVVRHTRARVSYSLEDRDAKKGKGPTQVTKTYDWELRHVKLARYPGYREDVAAAIDRGVEHLRVLQREDGSFEPHRKDDAGTTALAILTLAACGVPRDDPALEKAAAWLLERDPQKNYERAVGLLAFEKLYTPADEAPTTPFGSLRRDLSPAARAWCERVAAALERAHSSPGAFGYPPENARAIPNADTSNTQYAALGLRAATRLGIEVEESTWLGLVRYVAQVRERKGPKGSVALVRAGEAIRDEAAGTQDTAPVARVAGFRYTTMERHKSAWSSMTCAGIACLSVARHQLRRTGSRRLNKRMEREIEQMILGGWAWLDAHWGMDRHPEKTAGDWYYYYLYSLERAGVLGGVKRVGGKDWYFEGATELLARQLDDGSWKERGDDLAHTCFALLFLKRATAPLTGR